MAGCPLPFALADLADKGIDEDFSPRRVIDLRMELDAVKVAACILDGGHRRIVCLGHNFKSQRYFFHMIAVAHPDRTFPLNKKTAPKGPWFVLADQVGMAVFTFAGRYNLSPEVTGQELHAIADAEDRNAQFEEGFLYCWRAVIINGFGAARENYALRVIFPDGFNIHVKGMQFAIYMGFTDTPRNQLGVLGTEIKDENFFAVNIHLVKQF